jgi:hypothetical protein
MLTTFSEVISSIEGERKYQDYRWPGHIHSFEEYAVYMEDYLAELKHLASRNDMSIPENLDAAKDIMRKVTAMGVASMEQNGAKRRSGWMV